MSAVHDAPVWSVPASGADAAPAELAALQAAMLRAMLRAAPLPGGTAAPDLPDRAFLPADGPAPLSGDHLAPAALDAAGDVARAARADDAAFLHFAAPRWEGETLWLTVQVMLRPDGASAARPIGGVQVGFTRGADGWRTAAAPRAFAT